MPPTVTVTEFFTLYSIVGDVTDPTGAAGFVGPETRAPQNDHVSRLRREGRHSRESPVFDGVARRPGVVSRPLAFPATGRTPA